MHDRRIDGRTHTFGNQGPLFMNAMTWWDHETDSIWSQPWGMAIDGALKGVTLDLIPAGMVPWATWLKEHPETEVLKTSGGLFGTRRERFTEGYVIGVTLGGHATARERVINGHVGPFPVVVFADEETKAVHVYLRKASEQELEFDLTKDGLVDRQTGSRWDPGRGLAVEGPLEGQSLQQVPYITSFDWAWEDFYPHSENYD